MEKIDDVKNMKTEMNVFYSRKLNNSTNSFVMELLLTNNINKVVPEKL